MTVTSRPVRDILTAIAGGRHVLVTGHIDDLQLLRGDPATMVRTLELLGRTFDVVVRVNAVDGVQVVKGADRWKPDTDPRVDPLASVRNLMRNEEFSVLVIIDQADILLQDPADHDGPDRTRVATLRLALTEAATNGAFGNTCALVSASLADVPPVLRTGIERIAVVEVGRPQRDEREHYLRLQVPHMHGVAELDDAEIDRLVATLTQLTDGSSLREIESLVRFSNAMRIDAADPRRLLHRHRFGDVPDYYAAVRKDLPAIQAELLASVFGQDEAVRGVVAGLAGAALGLNMTGDPYSLETQPRLVSLLLGPTGVGKTELAKAVARALFGDTSAYLRIDMALFAEAHASERLAGAPPGFVGYEQGGELTNAVRARPFLVILLDEIEKAHPRTHDRLMSIIDDGRVTDAQGRVAHFNEAIIFMTSNLGSGQLAARAAHGTDPDVSPATADLSSLAPGEVEDVLRGAARDYFTDIGRVEIWGRLEQGTVAFQPLRRSVVEQIAGKILADTSFVHGPALDVDRASATAFVHAVMAEPVNRNLGGRQLRNTLRTAFLRLASWTVLNGHADAECLSVRFEAGGAMYVSVDGAPEARVDAPTNPRES